MGPETEPIVRAPLSDGQGSRSILRRILGLAGGGVNAQAMPPNVLPSLLSSVPALESACPAECGLVPQCPKADLQAQPLLEFPVVPVGRAHRITALAYLGNHGRRPADRAEHRKDDPVR